jgi:anti-sigma B factor antagonist
MDVNVRVEAGVTVVEVAGELTYQSAPAARTLILAAATPDGKMVLDMSRVSYLSSAGLRMLLMVYRTITGQGGRVCLAGLPEDIRNTMSITGFLGFFRHLDSVAAGITELVS